MTNEHLPYDLSLLMQKAGFDEQTERLISDTGSERPVLIDCPTYRQAFAWFRENKAIHGWIEPFVKNLFNRWTYCITIGGSHSNEQGSGLCALGSDIYRTHSEAEDACIRRMCEFLIENKTGE